MNFKINDRLRILLSIVLCVTFTCGFVAISLSDIETAILKKDFKRAEKYASEFIDHNPKEWQMQEAMYFLGVSQLYLEKFVQARITFEKLLGREIDQDLADKVQLGVIDSYDMAGDYETALSKAKTLFKARPQSKFLSLIYLKIARTNLRLARWEEARIYLEEIVSNFSRSPEFHTARQLLEEEKYFAVQVGSFLDQKKAVSLVEDFKKKDEYAYIVETADSEGIKLFRVRVGKFSSLKEAEHLEKRLSKQGYPTLIYP